MSAARSHCAACGWPLDGLRCAACGGDGVPMPLQDAAKQPVRAREVLDVTAERVLEAFHAGDEARAVELAITAEHPAAEPAKRPEGPAFVVPLRGTALFVAVDAEKRRIVVEAPIARLPQTKRMPALRALLEEADAEGSLLRPCLRGDLALLRFTGRIGALGPFGLAWLLRDAIERAERLADALRVRFDARAVCADDGRPPSWDVLGTPKVLGTLAAAPRRRDDEDADDERAALPPIPRRFTPAPEIDGRARLASGVEARAPREPDPEPPQRPLAPEPRAPRALELDAEPRPRVAVNAEPAPAPPSPARPLRAAEPAVARAPMEALEEDLPPILAPSLVRPQARAASSPEAELAPARRLASRVAMPEIDLGEAPATPPSARLATSEPSLAAPPADAAERLCELLRTAQNLATPLVHELGPTTRALIVRAAVFRAIYRFADAVPDAVASLYRTTVGAMGEALAPGPAQRRTPALDATVVEPSLVIMDRLVVLHARVPKERPLVVEPMTSVEEARAFLGRYREEIERAPADPGVLHFLAVGALSEFLVRAKLPAPMEARLREILGHVEADGPRMRAVDLLMTTLGRIIGA